MLLVGLTGGIGSGKSTAARLLAGRGAVVLDSDAFARESVSKGSPGFERVVRLFGTGILRPDGDLDREGLADIVFHDDRLRAELEDIVHPEVRRRIAEEIGSHIGTEHVVVVDSPLLFETGSAGSFQVVVVIVATPETRIARLAARGMDPQDARARLASQMPLEEKAARADIVLDNEGSLGQLDVLVARLWDVLLERARSSGA